MQTLDLEIKLPRALPWQADVLRDAKRFNVLVKGRRAGGTALAIRIAIEALLRGESVGWFSATYKLLDEARRELKRRLGQFVRRDLAQQHRMECYGGASLEMWSLDSDISARGRKYKLAVIDEAAFVPDMRDKWEQQIRPCLADLQGGAWFVSSPNGHNYLYTLWERGQDSDHPEWASWQLPTWLNPCIRSTEIDEAKATSDESNFRQEWGAEFVVRSGAVFPSFRRDRHVRALEINHALPIHIGVDFGFRTFAAVLFQMTSQGEIHIVGELLATECTTEEAVRRLVGLPFGNGKPFGQCVGTVGCDPAGDARNLHTGRSDVSIVRALLPAARVGFSTWQEHRSPEWRAGQMRNLLLSVAGNVRLFVDPSCKGVVRMFENSVYPEHKEGRPEVQEPVKDGVHDHYRDAAGYGFVNAGAFGQVGARHMQVSGL